MSRLYLRKYGAEATIDFQLFEADGVDFRVDAVHASGDTAIMKDEGAEANTSNGFTDEGNGYSIVLTATEMQAARIVVYVIDQTATKVWLDTALVIETYGHASAQHAMDLDDSVRGGLTALPNAAADAAGGLPISDAGGLDLDAKLANTNEVTAARMGALTDWINGGRLDLLLDAVKAKTDNLPPDPADASDIDASFSGLNDISAADVNAQMVDVLKTDTITLPGQEAPPLTPTFEEAVSWLYKVLRNRKRQSATLWELYADDESTVDSKATVSDDGTHAIKQEIVAGP